jgi:hypothetical protein
LPSADGCRLIIWQQVRAACHFYQKMGCTLGAIDQFAYSGSPGEVQLLWWKPLASCS